MGLGMLLAAAALAPPRGLSPPLCLSHFPPLRRHLPTLAVQGPSSPDDPLNPPDDSKPTPSSFNPAAELSAYQKKYSKGRALLFSITQAGPLRRGVAAIDDGLDSLRGIVRFYERSMRLIPVNRALFGLTLVAFGAQSAAGRAATMAGARMNLAILNGDQWHRLVTPIFLHGSGYHLMSNLYSLWRVGPLVEGLYGGSKTLLIYLLAGVGGNLAGLQWGALRSLSVGASGAVLGLMGAVAAYVMSNRQQLGRSGDALLTQVGQLLLLNLFIGLSPRSGIDNLGHFGGAATGFIFGWLLSPRASRDRYSSGNDGIIPFSVTRVMLAATLVATALSLRAGVQLTLALRSLAR